MIRDRWPEIAGAAFGICVALAYSFLATSTFGRPGVLSVVITVPAGMFLGWALVKLLQFAQRMLSD